jgi:DNA-binding transcriptional LysR family regulator
MKERLISFSADTPQGRLINDWWREHEEPPRSQIEVRAGQVACALAACGAGVAIVDDLTARAWRSEKLAFRPISRGPSFEVYAVRNANVAVSALARTFMAKVGAGFKAFRRE